MRNLFVHGTQVLGFSLDVFSILLENSKLAQTLHAFCHRLYWTNIPPMPVQSDHTQKKKRPAHYTETFSNRFEKNRQSHRSQGRDNTDQEEPSMLGMIITVANATFST